MKPKHPKSAKFAKEGLFEGISCFSDLEERIKRLDGTKEIGDAFEVFAEAYLFLFRQQDFEEIYPLSSAPPSLLGKVQLVSNDYGVDGLANDSEGSTSVYQVKFRSGRPSLSWREISTFMGISDSHNIKCRILITNCDDLPDIIEGRSKFFCIRGCDLDRLEQRDFEKIADWLSGHAQEYEKKKPKPHQQEALDSLIPAITKNSRTSAIMACGTGKTLLALWLSERLHFSKIIVLLPSLALLRQTLHEWLKETSWKKISYISVCSDMSVQNDDDSITTSQKHLDFPVTTDPGDIRKFLDSKTADVKVLFSTYHSAKAVSSAMQIGEFFDFGVFDEAHKTVGEAGKGFSFPLHDKNLKIQRRLFLTATPRTYSPNIDHLDGEPEKVQSMDNELIYGKRAFNLNFGKAVEKKIICPYKVLVTIVTNQMVSNELLDRQEVVIDGNAVNARVVANQIAIRKAINQYEPKKVFTFHQTVKSADDFTGNGPESIGNHVKNYKLFHVSGKMNSSTRDSILKDFRNSNRAIVSNARCLTEGVDVPSVDMVAFLSPKKSTVDIVQATGRAMRTADHKELGFVLVPIYVEIEAGETVEEAVERASYEEVWHVLHAMMDQDDDLYHAIQQLAVSKGKGINGDSSYFDEKIEISGGIIEVKDIVQAIRVRTLEEFFEAWRVNLGRLISFHDEHGHFNIPNSGTHEKLYRWTNRQRNLKRKGILSKEILNALNEINFDWKPYPWDDAVSFLKQYYQRHGHFQLPNDSQHKEFRGWLKKVRGQKLAGKLNKTLDKHLREIDFDWFDKKDWVKNLKLLTQFHEENGHFEVPENSKRKDYKALGDWVFFIRKSKANGKLDKELMHRLYDIGFSFVPKRAQSAHRKNKKVYDDGLDKKSKALDKLYSMVLTESPQQTPQPNNIVLVNQSTEEFTQDDHSSRLLALRSEIHQKFYKPWKVEDMAKKVNLSTSRFASLYKSTFQISPTEDLIRARIDQAKSMLSSSKMSSKKVSEACGFESVHYFHRAFKKRVNQTPKQFQKNHSLAPNNSSSTQLNEDVVYLCNKLRDFHESYGHFDVIPTMFSDYEEGMKLAAFVRGKRKAKASNNLEEFTEQELNKIGFEWRSKKERREQDPTNKAKPAPSMLDEIKSIQSFQNYLKSHAPNASEDIERKMLNQWMRSQRMLYHNGYINKQTKQELEQIKFNWDE